MSIKENNPQVTDYPTIFREMTTFVPQLGVDRTFKNSGAVSGPENPKWILGQTLYEIYVRAFSDGGTFNQVTKRLSNLKELGFNVLWFMPVYPIGKQNRKGSMGSPYAVRDYFTVNPEYGSEEDFKHLIRQAHSLGMHVIIDMVPNHVAADFKELKENPDLVVRDARGEPTRRIKDWTDITDLDYSNPKTREFMRRVMRFWIEAFDVDGYRVDVAGMVPLDFWRQVIPELRSLKNDFYLLAEWESPSLHEAGFNSTYDWSTLTIFRKVLQGKVKASFLADWILTKSAIYPQNSLPLRFIENHDYPRSAQTFPGEQLYAALTLMFTLHGIPLIYNGQEIGAEHQPSLFEREPIDWRHADTRVLNRIKQLISLRAKETAMQSANYLFYDDALNQGILAFNKDTKLRVLINLTDLKQPLPPDLISDIETIVFDSRSKAHLNGNLTTLEPYQALICTL